MPRALILSLLLALLLLVCVYRSAYAAEPAADAPEATAGENEAAQPLDVNALLLERIPLAWDTPRRVFSYADGPADFYAASPLPYPVLIERLTASDVVLIGELHEVAPIHRLELDAYSTLVTGAYLREAALPALGLEMFERDVQADLDAVGAALLAGDSAGAAELLDRTRPWGNFERDYSTAVYLAQLTGGAYPSNAPTPIARRVAKEGLEPVLASLTPEERGWIAETTTAPRDAYWEKFLEAMGGGASDPAHGMGMSEEQIYGYYVAQCLKDDTMAETIAALRDADPTRQVVHLSGSFHIDYKLGIYPRLLQRRPDDRVVTVALRPVADFEVATLNAALAAELGVADYVVFVLAEPAAAQP